ncbi:MAG: permease-like cell division protein FtsX [Oscillospiraceae bacterium]
MRHNRTGYYIREGISSIFTHGFMSFASVCIIVACLLIMGSFTLLALNVDGIIDTMENQNQMLAYVDENLSESEARALETKLEAVNNVESAVFVSREEAMDSFIESYDNPSLFDGLDASIFRHRFIIYLDDLSLMEQTQQDVANVEGIAWVNAHLEISRGFIRVRNIVSIVSMILVAILFIISLFIMSNTIKLTTFERKDEIAIMKMVGATSGFIRWPFVVEGLILGLIGSLTAFLLQWGVYQIVAEKLVANSGLSFLTVLSFSSVAVPLLIAFAVVGLGVGVIGSLMAIKNYLKV